MVKFASLSLLGLVVFMLVFQVNSWRLNTHHPPRPRPIPPSPGPPPPYPPPPPPYPDPEPPPYPGPGPSPPPYNGGHHVRHGSGGHHGSRG